MSNTELTKTAMVTLKAAWDSKNDPLRSYVLYKKASKICSTLADLLQSRANERYKDHCKLSPTGTAPFEIEECQIKKYVAPENWEYPEEVTMIAERIEDLKKKLALAQLKAKQDGTAEVLPCAPTKTIFTVDASRC